MMKNIPISYDDVDLSEQVFKKDVPKLKGKGTRLQSPIVKTVDNIKLHAELIHNGRKVELTIEVAYINDQSFLHSVDRSIKLKLLLALGTRKKGQNYDSDLLYAGIDDVLRHYNKADIYVERIHADNEFRTLTKQLVDKWDVAMNFSLPGAHVPDIERANRTLQERFRVNLYRLPFKLIPRTMIKYLALRVTRHGNYFPAQTGISRHYSPHTIVSGKQVDFKKEFNHSFGDYVQAPS